MPTGGVGEPQGAQRVAEHADAVAAHLGDRAIGVVVIHEPVVGIHTLRQSVQHPGTDQDAGGGDTDHPVRADTAVPVGQGLDAFGGQLQVCAWIRDDHEVVAGAVALDDVDLNHATRV